MNNKESFHVDIPQDVDVERIKLSEDRKYLCYETGISKNPDLDQKLFVVELINGNTVSSFSVRDLFGHGVFPEVLGIENNEIVFLLGDFQAHVSFDGSLINHQDYFKYRFVKALGQEYGYELFRVSEEMPPAEQIAVLGTVLKKKLDDKTRAKVNRKIAEIMDNQFSWYEKAEKYYQEALRLDKNVGCRKALEKCRKKEMECAKQ